MSESEFLFKLFGDAERRSPGSQAISRRIGKLCLLGASSKVLDLGCGTGPTARVLAKEFGSQLTCVDVDEGALSALRAAAEREGTSERIRTLKADARELSLSESFDAVIAEGSLSGLGATFLAAVENMRRHLAPQGRLAVTAMARVGRVLPEAVEAFYRDQGEQLRYPRELTRDLEKAGYEPQSIEAYADTVVDEHYRLVEQLLSRLSNGEASGPAATHMRREIEVFRREGGRISVNAVLVVGRRKEPGERPPAARGGA